MNMPVVTLKPFFCFYGGKWRAAPYYPAPTHRTIVEPFAGAAGYALRHHTRDVLLNDADPVIAGVWQYLIDATPEDIRSLPLRIIHVDRLAIPQAAKWLIGFWLNKGAASPCKTPSRWMRDNIRPNSYWGEDIRERIATQVAAIKHWRVTNLPYEKLPNRRATWYIDPPYQQAGKHYRQQVTDYAHLGAWCRTRQGQVIVCENEGAAWLPFTPHMRAKASPGRHRTGVSAEVIWCNHP